MLFQAHRREHDRIDLAHVEPVLGERAAMTTERTPG
jgi:hypothetical protein